MTAYDAIVETVAVERGTKDDGEAFIEMHVDVIRIDIPHWFTRPRVPVEEEPRAPKR